MGKLEWIYCEEKLPKTDVLVLAAWESHDLHELHISMLAYDESESNEHFQWKFFGDDYVFGEVYAWAIPEQPPREKGGE